MRQIVGHPLVTAEVTEICLNDCVPLLWNYCNNNWRYCGALSLIERRQPVPTILQQRITELQSALEHRGDKVVYGFNREP